MSFFGNRRQSEQPPPPLPPKPQAPPPVTAPSQPVGFETVLGANTTLEGTLRSNANVRLDGTFTGTLEINGNVLVGETAKINADINAKNVSIAGAVRGNVSGKKVQLLRTGRIWGDIRAAALTTEEGAFIDGKITMISQETPPGSGAPKLEDSIVTEEKESSMSSFKLDPPNIPADPDAISPAVTPTSEPAEVDAVSPAVTPTGSPGDPAMSQGATETDVDELFEEQQGDTVQDGLVENISAGHEAELHVGGDSTEGQTNDDFGNESSSDEPRQTT